jgi:hypothetical protein
MNFGGMESLGPPLGAICCPQLEKKSIMKNRDVVVSAGLYKNAFFI